jgi:RNA polymerase sigma-70 factor (ECF subfamily)
MKVKKKEIIIDEKVVKSFQAGELWAFEKIYQEISSFIYNVVLKMTKSPEETEDLTHDIFIKIYNSSKKFNRSVKLTTWAYRIAINHTLNHIKRKKTLITKLSEVFFHRDNHNSEEPVGDSDIREIVHRILSKIKPEFRICLILREFEDQSYHDIADILKISLGTVKSRISRGKTEFLRFYKIFIGGNHHVQNN